MLRELMRLVWPNLRDQVVLWRDGRKRMEADLVVDELRLVIEYDGCWFHGRQPGRDAQRNARCEHVGWTVVRVREEPLPLLSPLDVGCGPCEDMVVIAERLLASLATRWPDLPSRFRPKAAEAAVERGMQVWKALRRGALEVDQAA
jgi:hypothetical protein